MRVRTMGITVMIIAGLAASIGSGSSSPGGGGGGKKTSGPRGGTAAHDVAIASCTKSTRGAPAVKVKIVNHSSKTSNYVVVIAFESPDGKIHYHSSLASRNLAPGQSREQHVALRKSVSGKVTCKVTAVTRYAS
jgi:hypothetical protein